MPETDRGFVPPAAEELVEIDGDGNIRKSPSRPKSRIEKLGELYDAAIERVNKRQKLTGPHVRDEGSYQNWVAGFEAEHKADMDVIALYLAETREGVR